jgi:hypothetical protein
MHRRMWCRRLADVVISKDPTLPVAIELVLETGHLDLRPPPFRGVLEEELEREAKIPSIGQRCGVGRALPASQYWFIASRAVGEPDSSGRIDYSLVKDERRQLGERLKRFRTARLVAAGEVSCLAE